MPKRLNKTLIKSGKEAVDLAKIFKGGLMRAIRFLKKSKALTPLIISVVALNLCIVASVAWFTINRRTDADEMGMALAVDDTTAVYKAYRFDMETMKGTDKEAKTEENPNPGELNITNIDLNQYDTIFQAQNKYTPAFARIEITRNDSMPESGTVYITIERNDLEAQAGELELFSSSVVRFTAFIDHDKGDLEQEGADALYHCINDQLFDDVKGYTGNAPAHSKTFVTVIGEGAGHTHDKVDSITLALEYKAGDWYEKDGDDMLNVYLYMSYDVQLIECFMDEHTDGGISLDDNIYFFDNDLKKVSVSYEKKETN